MKAIEQLTERSKSATPSHDENRERAIRVIESCRTMEQLEVAKRYAELSGMKGDGVTEGRALMKYLILEGI